MNPIFAALEKLKQGQMLGNPLNGVIPEDYRPIVSDVVQDIVPVSAQQRSMARIGDNYEQLKQADNPISKALRTADIALEGVSLGADALPFVKAGAMAIGSTLPFFLRGQKGLNAGKFGQAGVINDIPAPTWLRGKQSIPVGVDINKSEAVELLRDSDTLRTLDGVNGETYFWNASDALHADVGAYYNLPPNPKAHGMVLAEDMGITPKRKSLLSDFR